MSGAVLLSQCAVVDPQAAAATGSGHPSVECDPDRTSAFIPSVPSHSFSGRAARCHAQAAHGIRAAAEGRDPGATAPDRFKLQLTISGKTRERLEEARDLLAQEVPDGDPAEVMVPALDALLRELRRKKYAETEAPRKTPPATGGDHARHISHHVRREVARRDGHQCTFDESQAEYERGDHMDALELLADLRAGR